MQGSLQEALDDLQSDSGPDIGNEVAVADLSADEIHSTLNHALEAVTSSPESILDETTFDTFRSLLKYSDSLSRPTFSKLIDTIVAGFSTQLDHAAGDRDASDPNTYRSHRPALEAFVYLLTWTVVKASKAAAPTDASTAEPAKKGRGKAKAVPAKSKGGEWTWADSVPAVLAVITKALHLRTDRIWTTSQDKDTFVGCFIRSANVLAENESFIKTASIRDGIFDVFCVAARSHGQTYNVKTTVLQNLQYFEHLAEPMAELTARCATVHEYPELADDVLRDLAGKTFIAQDPKGPKSFAKFLVSFAELLPRQILKQIIVLQKHLDSDAYTMRMALVDILGIVITALATATDANGDKLDPATAARQADGFFSLLFDRFLDVNGFVRAKVVNVCIKLCDNPIKYPRHRLEMTKQAVRSLKDKSSQVRKNCVALLIKLITTHPYGLIHGGTLSMKEWQQWYEDTAKALEPLDQAANAEAQKALDEGLKEPDGTAEEGKEGGEAEAEGQESEEEAEEEANKSANRSSDLLDLAALSNPNELAALNGDQVATLRLQKRYYTDALAFITLLDRATLTVADLLMSKVKSEALEAMDFFCVAHEYNLTSSEIGVKRMIHLIWAKDASTVEDGRELKSIRARVIECYRKLYFDFLADLPRDDNVLRTARNMISLTETATLAELTSLEQLMTILMANGDVEEDVIDKLWQVYSAPRDIARSQRRGAILLLGMFAAAKPDVVANMVDVLLRVGLGALGRADLVLAKYTCIALRRLAGSQKKVKGSLVDNTIRLPMESPVFSQLRQLLEAPSTNKEWFAMAEQALNTIYVLGEQPDRLASDVLQSMTRRVFSRPPVSRSASMAPLSRSNSVPAVSREASTAPEGEDATPEAEAGDADVEADVVKKPGDLGSAFELAQLISLAGHCAIKHLVHLELVEREYKRRKAESENANAAEKGKEQDELDQVAGSVEDDVADAILHARESELLYGVKSILSVFAPMSVQICSQPKAYPSATLRAAAVLAMSKFMCVSAKFCDEHLMLFFKLLETANNPVIRSNIVIALGDLAVCFSNIMDENSDRLYLGLLDSDLTVKKNTLMVLTHLILNGMIKVKGQLGEMAKCIVDEQERISGLAKLFFEELSTKDNAIYNNLPDIISHLSLSAHAVDEEAFEKIMTHIFKYIEKEKQAEQIIEKLCQRFKLSSDERQWRDVAFCLSMLPFKSERSITKLVEALPDYQDKLYEPTVFARLQEILVKARANKPDKRSEIFEQRLREFEEAMAAARTKGQEEQTIQKRVETKKKRTAAKGKAAKGKRGRKKAQSETPPSSD